ncbi:MAG: FHA domain-containing protein [Syntrophobacteraceae bacterium]
MKRAPVIVVQIVHLHGPMKGQIQEFTDDVIGIGRHPTCQVRFPADLAILSRKHAEIVRDGNRYKITDMSHNGTFVNGKRVTEGYLKSGDVLTFAEGGPKVSFLTQITEEVAEASDHGQAPAEPPPPVTPPPAEPPRRREEVREARETPPPPSKPEPRSFPQAPMAVELTVMPLVLQYGPTLRSYKQLPVTIGKHPNCQFAMNHPGLLDMHAQIFSVGEQYWVKDLTGRNLVRINGEPIGLQGPLASGDNVALTPQGPVFRYLGEGRFAEVEDTPEVKGEAPSAEAAERHDHDSQGKPAAERKSVLKRFFK